MRLWNQDGEIVDISKRKEQIFTLCRPVTPGYHHKMNYSPVTQSPSLPVTSVRYAEEETVPGWWFHDFEPVWKPFIQRLCRQKGVTLLEFEQAASQIPGLTHIEKTIAISAFRQQQEDGLPPSRSTTPLHSERNLFAV